MKNSVLLLLTAGWLMAAGTGFGILTIHDFTPCQAAGAPSTWPAQSRVSRDKDRATLVMFAHPDCPCTRASIGNLAVLMDRCQGLVDAHVVFFQPPDAGADWLQTDLWRSAAAIPGVQVQGDAESREMKNFQASTSGDVLLYDAGGKLLFNGGITSSRGHYGDSEGLSILMKLLHHQIAAASVLPVYGCSLLDPSSSNKARATLWTR